MTKRRPIEEIKEFAKSKDVEEEYTDHRDRGLIPSGLTADQAKLVMAATEDYMDLDEDWKALYEACVGKSDEEIVERAYNATKLDA